MAWQPVEALEAALLDVKEGRVKPTKLVIQMIEGEAPDDFTVTYIAAQVDHFMMIALMQIAIFDLMRMMKGENDPEIGRA